MQPPGFLSHSTPDETSIGEVLCNILADNDADKLSAAASSEVESVRIIIWKRVRSDTEHDTTIQQFIVVINLEQKCEALQNLR